MTNNAKFVDVVSVVEKYINRYVVVPFAGYSFAAALWVVATHFVEQFESVPYMVITSLTRQSGKSLLMELLKHVSANPFDATGVTASALYRTIDEKMPTVFVDESESLNKESNPLRPFLNVGYRKGQTIPRTQGKEVVEFNTFGFKEFTLIGDVYATLRDRSIIIFMKRATPEQRVSLKIYMQSIAKSEGESLRDMITQEKEAGANYSIEGVYGSDELNDMYNFLPSRDAEIWRALFSVCKVFCPQRMNELKRIAVDMSTEKTQEVTRESADAEEAAANNEYKTRLLNDMVTLSDSKGIKSSELLPKLYSIDVAPWRKYKGRGITLDEVGLLMGMVGVKSKAIRFGKGKNGKVERGYSAADLKAAINRI